MKLRTGASLYLALAVAGILANFVLWRYRLHLYDLNTDRDIEPMQHIQVLLFRGTEAFLGCGLAYLAWLKSSGKK